MRDRARATRTRLGVVEAVGEELDAGQALALLLELQLALVVIDLCEHHTQGANRRVSAYARVRMRTPAERGDACG